jgi:hypothetical protein
MTNLFEKALLTAFGILTLIIFLSIINPFLKEIATYYNIFENEKTIYNNFINNVDHAINHVIENPDDTYFKEINYPKNLNISFKGKNAKYEYFVQYQHFSVNKDYSEEFVSFKYLDIIPDTYNLIISYRSSLINVSIN